MTALEDKLNRYTKPSSDDEQEKQARAERMVRGAVAGWPSFAEIELTVLPKGSYKNNTNVRQDSDVDVAVIHEGMYYYDDAALRPGDRLTREGVSSDHLGDAQLRQELVKCLYDRFGTAVDATGKTAIAIPGNSGRVSTDVVPSFRFRLYCYGPSGRVAYHEGTKTWRTDGTTVVNYPQQQYDNGVLKNERTGRRYKSIVRILKRVENDLVAAGELGELPSYFMECLGYVVPNVKYGHRGSTPLTDDLRAALGYIWENATENGQGGQWLEPNGIKVLFGAGQKWAIRDARNFTQAAWNHLGL